MKTIWEPLDLHLLATFEKAQLVAILDDLKIIRDMLASDEPSKKRKGAISLAMMLFMVDLDKARMANENEHLIILGDVFYNDMLHTAILDIMIKYGEHLAQCLCPDKE